MAFQKIEPGVWKPEKGGDSITGVLIKVDKEVGQYKSFIYNLETENQEQMAVWGSAILDRKMAYVKVGDRIRITFKGKEPSKSGEDTKLFEVEVDKE